MAAPESAGLQLVSANELADVLGCSVRVIREMSRYGLLPYYPIGKRRRYDIKEVLEAVRQPAVPRIEADQHFGLGKTTTPHLKVEARRKS